MFFNKDGIKYIRFLVKTAKYDREEEGVDFLQFDFFQTSMRRLGKESLIIFSDPNWWAVVVVSSGTKALRM